MSRYVQRRRTVVATVVSGALLLLGPAAYGVATAAGTVDEPAATSSQESQESQDPDDPDGGEQSDGQAQEQQSQDQQDQGQQDQQGGGERAAAEEGEDGTGGKGDQDGATGGLDVLATDCSGSRLAPHDGFQKAPRCVATAFGEVSAQGRNPSLLITDAPRAVAPGAPFQLTVSTRNLVRDRFLAAGQGGYYKEASVLNGQGIQRGHFHTACRILLTTDEAPDAAPEPAFFLATEDGSGSSTPDSVRIDVPGVDEAGDLQCASWAGDGSHRIPMMQRADQTPAFDSVRIRVG